MTRGICINCSSLKEGMPKNRASRPLCRVPDTGLLVDTIMQNDYISQSLTVHQDPLFPPSWNRPSSRVLESFVLLITEI